MSEVVLTAIHGPIAQLTLNRPESYNALNIITAQALTRKLLDLGADPAIRGLVITGNGTAFSAGGDIKFAQAHPHGPAAAFHELATHVHVCVTEIRRLRKPVIAAINGIAAGGGFSLALSCDFRIMADSARLKQGFTSNALCIDAGGTFTLPRLVGLARALEIAAFDEPITAEQALSWGLVTRVVSNRLLLETALGMAHTLAEKSLHTFEQVKALLTDSFDTSWETQLERERRGLVACAGHPDGQEGMRAFLEKRPPRYNTE
ncbi:MAG TPA: enoyl-CoA hydratase-related protein [Candidatus Competibacteraceae bacterium]|nr:enoyl-CoA hydratase-related protein [Candidatus Competibacteraceae bacterium]